MRKQEYHRLWALDTVHDEIKRWQEHYGPQRYSSGYPIPSWPPTENQIERTIKSLIIGSHSGRIGAQI